MYKRKAALSIIALAALFMTACSNTGGAASDKQSCKNGISLQTDNLTSETRPDFDNFKVKKIDGTETDMFHVLGSAKLTVVNIWEPSCESCRGEMENLASLSSKYSDKGIQIVGIIKGVTKEPDQAAQEMISKTGAKYVQLLDSKDLDQFTKGQENTQLPAALFFSADGKQLGKTYNGAKDKAFLEKEMLNYYNKACEDKQPSRAVG